MNPVTLAALSDAGTAATSFIKRNARWIAAAVVLLMVWMLFKPYIRLLFGLVPDDAQLQMGDGDVYRSFYDQRGDVASKLSKGLSAGWLESVPFFGGNDLRCDVLYEALQWNSNQLRVVHNAYKNANGETLYSALQALSTDACSSFLGDGLNEQLSARLKTLGLV